MQSRPGSLLPLRLTSFTPWCCPIPRTTSQPQLALAASIGAVFLGTLIVVSFVTVKLSDLILDSKIGALDRTLGFLFGAARGLLIAVIAFVFFDRLVGDKRSPIG